MTVIDNSHWTLEIRTPDSAVFGGQWRPHRSGPLHEILKQTGEAQRNPAFAGVRLTWVR